MARAKAVIHLTRRMATKLIKDNINVTAIAPGAFASDMNRAARDQSDELAKRIPSQRIGTTRTWRARDLASRAGDYVVGNTIAVDGGVVYANAGLEIGGKLRRGKEQISRHGGLDPGHVSVAARPERGCPGQAQA